MTGVQTCALPISDNKVSIKPVTAGETVGEQWIVKGDLKAGDRVIAEGVQKVLDGMEVKPVPYTGDIAAAPTK